MNGVEIKKGDKVNICFTTYGGEHIHDCVYVASRGHLGGLEFIFDSLLWESYGYNQFPTGSSLCEKYGSLNLIFENDKKHLVVDTNDYNYDTVCDFPFNKEKVFSGYSRYFKVIDSELDK